MPKVLSALASIGGGNMATAILAGLRRVEPELAITVIDPVAATRARHAALGATVVAEPQASAVAPVMLLAVKPQMVDSVLTTWQDHLTEEQLLISILAGTPIARLEALTAARIVRAMPNTPMTIGQGMTGIAAGRRCRADDLAIAETVLGASGAVVHVAEEQLDALTAVSGSGPAYVFHFAECLVAAAQDLGLAPELAVHLVAETLSGSVNYLRSQEGFPAAQLRQQVTSPGGTTAAALAVFAEADLAGIVARALAAAQHRSQELAQQ